MKKTAFVLLLVMFLTIITMFAESTSITTNERERNVDVQIETLGNGDVKLTWDEVSGAGTYKIYYALTPDSENFDLLIELDSSYLFHQLTPDSEREFYFMTYTFTTSGGFVTDFDGNVYQTLVIGNQEWMIENLKVTHYRDGYPISNVTDGDEWGELSTGAYCYYENSTAYGETYGSLYNWYAVADPRGLAPEGWRIPSDNDIKQLEMYLGMSESQANATFWRGTNEGSKLAGGYELWASGNLRNNSEFDSSGFGFLPGGYRHHDGSSFNLLGNRGSLWSSAEDSSTSAWYRGLTYDQTTVSRYGFDKRNGFSVRCVKDVE